MNGAGRQSRWERWSVWFATRPGTSALICFGLLLRCYHYLRGPSLWHDEAALVVNVLNKSFSELLGPLFFSEAAPPLFLWLERAAAITLGDSLYVLRLPAFLASCASLILIAYVARRWLPAAAASWAILLFACSDKLLWHSCEAKQYTLEALTALVMVALYIRSQDWLLELHLLLFASLAPLLMSIAYPGCFLYGALLVAFLPGVWKSRQFSVWLCYVALATCVFATFGLLWIGPMHAQRDATIVDCWEGMQQFPDWGRPWSVPGWMLQANLDLVGYFIRPIGQICLPLAVVGAFTLWRRRMFAELILLAAPILLAAGASCFKAYPFGGIRVMAYAGPAIVLCVAAGAAPCIAWLLTRQRMAAWVVTIVLLSPALFAVRQTVVPWPRADCAGAAAFVETHRKATDQVVANHWEYLYYFRGLGGRFSPLERFMAPRQGRVWFVTTAGTQADRESSVATNFPPTAWRALERGEFARTTVVLVETQPSLTASEPPTSIQPR